MRDLSHKQRKLVYLGGVLALMIPVVFLGMPADAEGNGGYIAERRIEQGLGEASLGEVDPASSSANLLLLGFRGIAANMLWMQADQQKETKQFTELEQSVNAIIKLQPHYLNVWKFQGWNLAYNVSAEFDSIPDRFEWIKRGTKFLDRGIARNERAAELQHDQGDFVGKKIGESDEWRLFRRYFLDDPDDARFPTGPDPDINPDNEDNYEVAKKIYQGANDTEAREDGIRQRKMARSIFRSYVARAQLDLADVMQREGKFDQVDAMKAEWREGNDIWANDYGKERFYHSIGGGVVLNYEDADLEAILAEENPKRVAAGVPEMTLERKYEVADQMQKMVNYNYWLRRSALEAGSDMIEARRLLYSGKRKLLDEQLVDEAREDLYAGMELLEGVIKTDENGDLLLLERDVVEDAVKSQIMWRHTLTILGEEVPEEYPLKDIWTAADKQGLIAEMREKFQNRIGSGG